MTIFILQHVPFEGPGLIAELLTQMNQPFRIIYLYRDEALPALDEVSGLIVMGGPMSANDEAVLPWLVNERQLIVDCFKANIPVLGICLGAQQMAKAFGGRVAPNPQKEIGWFPLQGVAQERASFTFPTNFQGFHWHGETFSLPSLAHLLASSVACVNQAFQMGPRAIGLQFHLEMDPEGLDALLFYGTEELIDDSFVQNETLIRSLAKNYLTSTKAILADLLAYLF